MSETRPKVTVYVPCASYGRFLTQCLESVAQQSFAAWEAIVIDDASGDETAAIAAAFAARFPERARVVRFDTPRGLRAAANVALDLARGEYVMRLDADDWLDPSALLVLVDQLDRQPNAGLAYPGWTLVDEAGAALAVERPGPSAARTALADRPAHGAGSLVRLRVLKAIGGYDGDVGAQDGHELWLKAATLHGVIAVATPLFFYRQHASSLSRNDDALLAARAEIKRRVVRARSGAVKPRVAAVVPVKNSYADAPGIALEPLGGRPLLDWTLDLVDRNSDFDAVIVTTDDPAVAKHAAARGFDARVRDRTLSDPAIGLADVARDALRWIDAERGIDADIVVLLGIHTPIRTRAQVREAIDTLLIYPVEQVIGVREIRDLCFRHDGSGLKPLNAAEVHALRLEREAILASNAAIHALWREALAPERFLVERVGHIVMPRAAGLSARRGDERDLVDRILRRLPPRGVETPRC